MSNVNKDSTDFMIKEYDQIASAYFGLRDQVNEWFKSYIALVGLPITVLVAIARLESGSAPVTLFPLPDTVAFLLLVVSILGLFVAISIIAMRMEMIQYARTINGIRRFFAQLDLDTETDAKERFLASFLMLPTSDSKPPFFESWRAMFWQVNFIGVIDGLLCSVALQGLLSIKWILAIVIGLCFFSSHLGVYWLMAEYRESIWNTKFPEEIKIP